MAKLRDLDEAADLYGRLRLDHVARARGAIVVEGPEDERAWKNVLDEPDARFFVLNGRTNVLRFVSLLRAAALSGVVCVLDRDFDDEALAHGGADDVVFSDNADTDAMIFFSPALDRVLEEWANRTKLAARGGTDGVRTEIVEALRPMGALRRRNWLAGLGLQFEHVDAYEMAARDSLTLEPTRIATRLANGDDSRRVAILAALAEDCPDCPVTGRPLVRGKDCFGVLGRALRRAIGSLSEQQVTGGFVGRSLRVAVRPDDLRDSPAVNAVRAFLETAAV